jgi:hypothetical protein
MGIEIWVIIINIIFYSRFLWNFTRKQKTKTKTKRTASQDQQLLIRETIKSFQWLLLHHPNWRSDREKFHLGRKEKKRAKKSRNLKLFNGFFFSFFLLGGKTLTSKAILYPKCYSFQIP